MMSLFPVGTELYQLLFENGTKKKWGREPGLMMPDLSR
jgi:hypothetical protein